ncbi:hypothetical protein NMG60_11026411 [Bertholletia excelsa]
MGRVRAKTVNKLSRRVIEHYYSKMTLDLHANKKTLEVVAIIPSKRLRYKIAGFSTHPVKRTQKGLRRMDFFPDEAAVEVNHIEVDKETIDLLAYFRVSEVPGVVLKDDMGDLIEVGAGPVGPGPASNTFILSH